MRHDVWHFIFISTTFLSFSVRPLWRAVVHVFFFCAEDWTQDLTCARQVLYQAMSPGCCPIFQLHFLLLIFQISLYILDTNPSSYVSLAHFFLPVCGFLLLSLSICFTEWKSLVLMKSNLIDFFTHGSFFHRHPQNFITKPQVT